MYDKLLECLAMPNCMIIVIIIGFIGYILEHVLY